MRAMWIRGLQIGLTVIGTTIGAGFASGRELWEFFASYGTKSHYGILLSMGLVGALSIMILWMSWARHGNHYYDLLRMIMGKKLAAVYDIFMVFYLLSLTVVMFAGSGAAFERWNFSFLSGVLFCAGLVILVVMKDGSGILAMNVWLMPVLILSLIALSLHYLFQVPQKAVLLPAREPIWPSAILYASLNTMPLLAVLSTFGKQVRSKGEIWIAGLVSAAGLGTVALSLNAALLRSYEWMAFQDIPIFALMRIWPDAAGVGMTLLLWVAIFTTAVSGVYGIVQRIRAYVAVPVSILALVLVLIMIPLSRFGFKQLIGVLYPLFGIMNLFLVAAILLFPLRYYGER